MDNVVKNSWQNRLKAFASLNIKVVHGNRFQWTTLFDENYLDKQKPFPKRERAFL